MKLKTIAIALALVACGAASAAEYTDLIQTKINGYQVKPEDDFYKNVNLSLMKKGSKSKDVPELAKLLQDRGLLAKDIDVSKVVVFDDAIENAVKAAQEYFGLKSDGIAGAQLYVNLSVTDKLKRVTLETWKKQVDESIAQAKERGHKKVVIVNVASFTLRAIDVDSGKTIVESPVIIGKPTTRTPLFLTNLIGVKYNPTWNPPPGIMKKEVLPKLGKDEGWFKKSGLRIVDSEGETVDPASITSADWREGGYRIYQPAGDDNALGVLKFETDNTENIYLHDTNARRKFDNSERALSHGCVRVKEWLKLASFVLDRDSSKVQSEVDKDKTYIERIKPVPVYIMYSLADLNGDKVVFYPDIYNVSKDPVLKGLKSK